MVEKLEKLYLNAGQMKAGTSYLYRVMRPHKQLFGTPIKELHYLSHEYGTIRLLNERFRQRQIDKLMERADKTKQPESRRQKIEEWGGLYLRPLNGADWYRDLFRGCRADQWAMDFSNLTCTIPVERLQEVARIAGDVRVTYCIRDAVPRAFSHAKFRLHHAGQSHDLTKLSPRRLRRLLLESNVHRQAQSESHIESLHKVFGNERLRIIRCEDMWRDPRKTANGICDFLEIAPLDGEIKSEAVNVGPKTAKTAELEKTFHEIFGPLQEKHDALLERYRDIVIS